MGRASVVAVHGAAQARLCSFISRSINQPKALRRIAITVQPRMVAALRSWAERGTINASKEVNMVTFENIGKYFAGFEPGPRLHRLDECFVGLVSGMRSYQLNIPGSAYYHALQCRKEIVATVREELKKRKKDRKGDKNIKPMNDLMDGLMNLTDDERCQLRDNEVLDNIVSVLVAGYKSTALATMWVIYYLAKFPTILEKLREENMSIKKIKDDELITSDEILKMKYTTKVVEETIRMANIAAILFRTTTKDVEYKGYTIPKGWNVMLWIRYLHTDPENFKDPMCFNPDRWDASTTPESYLVFGGGSRLCAGNMLARLQLAIFLHHLTTGC